jgi:hypothetical protein
MSNILPKLFGDFAEKDHILEFVPVEYDEIYSVIKIS